jgi:hypothetical protein
LVLVGFSVELELAPDGVADPAFETTERFSSALGFGEFASVIGPAGCVVSDLGDGSNMDGILDTSPESILRC